MSVEHHDIPAEGSPWPVHLEGPRPNPISSTVLSHIPGGIYRAVYSPDGRIRELYLSDSYRRLLGWDPPALMANPAVATELIHPDDRVRYAAMVREKSRTLGEATIEYRIVAADGRVVWIRDHARFHRGESGELVVDGVDVDITERKELEVRLAESETRWRRAFYDSPIGAAVVSLEAKILDANDELCRMLGRTREELISRSIGEISHPDDPPRSEEMGRRLLGGEIDHFEMEKRYLRKDGTELWGLLSVRLARDARGEPLYFLPMLQDITHRREADDALRRSEERQRQVALSNQRLLQEVNHRVRNNLGALLSLIYLSKTKFSDVGVFASAIGQRVRMLSQVHNLMAAGNWQGTDLGTVVRQVANFAMQMPPHTVDASVEGPRVYLESVQVLPVAMMISELFSNSIRHGAFQNAGGRVRVAWSSARESGGTRVRLAWTESGGPRVSGPVKAGMGMELIEGFVVHDLGGRCELRFPPEGASHRLELLIADAPMRDAPPAAAAGT